jgi:hypothetical protein
MEDAGALIGNRRYSPNIEIHNRVGIEVRQVSTDAYHRMPVEVGIVASPAAAPALT